MKAQAFHWADINADKVIRERGDKEQYTCASGITPSGTVHIGNFREIISVDLVARALRDKGKKVRFIYSWDNYDVFRKVPTNMPDQETLKQYLRKPITLVPDTLNRADNYARGNEKDLEALLPVVGVEPEYIYQAGRYRKGDYAEGMRKALEHRDTIRAILNEHRTSPLEENWWPISVFCQECDRDDTQITGWDGDWTVSYTCSHCKKEYSGDLRSTPGFKLFWRIDWPMRWAVEGVDFEPAGKDHHSEGGSFDTAKEIVRRVYDTEPPATFQYDFIRIKGRGGKISSSSGEVVSLPDVLEIYQPEIVRYMFAGTRPNTEFAISFDLDVLKIYEDYDKCERIFFGQQEINEKKKAKEDRIYELSQVGSIPEKMPYQLALRHLCNLLQMQDGNIDGVIASLEDIEEDQIPRFKNRCECAWNWVTQFAPEDFRFAFRTVEEGPAEVSAEEKKALAALAQAAEGMDQKDEKEFGQAVYDAAHAAEVDTKVLFKAAYQALIGKEKGPRLAGFMKLAGEGRVKPLLNLYR